MDGLIPLLQILVVATVGGCTVFIGTNQFWLAKKKRKDDLFKLRFEVFMKVLNLWGDLMNETSNLSPHILKFHKLRYEAKFIFGDDTELFLKRLHEEFAKLQCFISSEKHKEAHELHIGMLSRHDELIAQFEPHLKLEKF